MASFTGSAPVASFYCIRPSQDTSRMASLNAVSFSVGKSFSSAGVCTAPSHICFAGAINDIKLPRRSLLVHFTCDACGVRSQRLINRLAYEKGTVYVQCSGCSQYHKLVDNLNLVVEYDFRDTDLSTDSVEQARHGS